MFACRDQDNDPKWRSVVLMETQIYDHYCPHCNHSWKGIKPVAVSCVRCKHRLDYNKKWVNGKNKAIQYIELSLIAAGIPQKTARMEAKRRLKTIIQP